MHKEDTHPIQLVTALPDSADNALARRSTLYIFVACAVILELIPFRWGDVRLNVLLFCLGCLFVITVRIKYLARRVRMCKGPALFIILYAMYLLLSAAWSDVGLASAIDALPIILCCAAALALADYRSEDSAEAFLKIAVLICLLSWLLALVRPDVAAFLGPGWRLNGVMSHPQRLTLALGLALLMLITLYLRAPTKSLPIARMVLLGLPLALTLLAAQARAFTTFLLIVAAFSLARRFRARGRFLCILAALFVAASVSYVQPDIASVYAREDSNTETLSGRTTIWAGTYELAWERPMLGSGFGSFLSERTASFFSSYVAPHAHNDALNIFYESGIIGLILIMCFVLTASASLGFHRNRFFAPILLFVLLCGSTGVLIGGKISTPFAIVVLITFQELRARQILQRSNSYASQ